MILDKILFFTALLLVALMAGLFFSFSVSVTQGLGKLDNLNYLRAMQHINREILNPVFLLCFTGAPFALIGATITKFIYHRELFVFMTGITLLYIIGVFLVTMLANVPLNNYLAALHLDQLSAAELEAARSKFEQSWNRFNHIRTVFSIAACALLIYIKIK
ncbi:DUF1772 domain-containing protein [Niabella beijingensis]|uniref:anthrone oxygenase family protein n=1 Tax=Niabella beijingensis TaxID=2872700 RepID=UPI001CBA84CC|nr:anthrone oxygenase family protein [Niabella beijingensis]MBZ4187761.1 DUF1772 domain-containing protein [Niabella beijingensis]